MKSIRVGSYTELTFLGKFYRCVAGVNGFTDRHREGDQSTPTGRFILRECWYRADRIAAPETSLKLRTIETDDGWCDAPTDPQYNKHIKLPYAAASHERLWRDDHIYDIIVPLGYNDNPVVRGLGSAIFFHLATPNYSPTLGCIAVLIPDMFEILKQCDNDTQIIIEPTARVGKLYRTDQQS